MGLTPMMRQYFEVKERYNDCILFFRLGDFYEMFFEDAKTASRELELVLTGRDCGLEERAPMCGIPFHASQSYIGRLVSKGYKVAICEQVEDPAQAKGIVKRDVIKVITPGTYIDSNAAEDQNVYLMSIYNEDGKTGVALTDISTGEFKTTSFNTLTSTLIDEITKINPKEIIIDKNVSQNLIKEIQGSLNGIITYRDFENYGATKEEMEERFLPNELSSLDNTSLQACRMLLSYILETQKISLTNINSLERYEIVNYMTIDASSRRNLELTENTREKTRKGSLLWVLDKTSTTMGARTLRKWIDEPLLSREEIERRLNSVEELYSDVTYLDEIRDHLQNIYDMERIVGKISNGNVNAKDLVSLRNSLDKLPGIKELLSNGRTDLLREWYGELDTLDNIKELLHEAILDDPAITIKEGNIIKSGYSTEVDELRVAKTSGKEWIAALESREREETGIKSLKVGYNKVFGYYIEISRANFSSIPEGRYIRKQTLANAERYITEELKVMEEKILGAEEKLVALEYKLFLEIRSIIEKDISRIKQSARIISNLDALGSLALVSLQNDYVKPSLNEEGIIDIEDGRHPVVEKVIDRGDFISNNTKLNKDDCRLMLITGPNMAGKSTYMRQVALITIMCQIGCFVPCKSANISICDKVFTRIGASDDLAGGKSTFMVEMWEVSNILKNATPKSLVLLDEVGRGTSTYDGLSIAWSVIEYISSKDSLKCNTLFATHYHELTKLEGEIQGVKNYSVSVKEFNDEIIFLRKIVEGGADQSYGIEVAKLAGLPEEVITRGKEILSQLEGTKSLDIKEIESNIKNLSTEVTIDNYDNMNINYKEEVINIEKSVVKEESSIHEIKEEVKSFIKDVLKEEVNKEAEQLDFTYIEKEALLKELSNVDVMSLNPLEAMNKLYKLVQEAKRFN